MLPRPASIDLAGAHPQPGDVVVLQLTTPRGTRSYVLFRLGRRAQVFFATYADAMTCALKQAAHARVDAWYTSDEDVFVRLTHGS